MSERREQALAKFCQNRELVQSQLIYWKRRVREAERPPFVEVQRVFPASLRDNR
jgi:hypothetical protein